MARGLTLEEFLKRPEIDESPVLEYIGGRVEAKPLPQRKHCVITNLLTNALNQVAEPPGLGTAFGELRCTFGGRSMVPDVVFQIAEHVELDDEGEYINESLWQPGIHVEILSPDQSAAESIETLSFSARHGCRLGWLIDPERKTIRVRRPGRKLRQLPADGVLEGEPVLPGFRLPVAELFGWLRPRGRGDRA
jgi:Uma2 family endonuclease